MNRTPNASPEARQALLDEICGQLLSPNCGMFVEDMLPRLPEYDSEELLDLIDAELCRRTDRGEAPSFDEYAGRFPQLSMETLAQLFEVHLLETGARRRETPNYHLSGVVQGTLVSRCDDGEIRRARREDSTEWIAVRVFATASWSEEQRCEAARWLLSAAHINHPHLLKYQVPVRRDDHGNLYAWLPNAEGTRLTTRLARPIDPRLAAKYLLPVAGVVELARQQGVWLGEVQAAHLQIDHYNKLRLLGSGDLTLEMMERLGRFKEKEDNECEDRAIRSFGKLWEQMIGPEKWSNKDNLESDLAVARESGLAIGKACREHRYVCFGDFISDLETMRLLDANDCRKLKWKCEGSTRSGWLPWR